MNNWIINQAVDLARSPLSFDRRQSPLMVPGDSQAHTISITVLNNGAPVDLTGYNVTGYFVSGADEETVIAIKGRSERNVVTVTLSSECYAYNGTLRCVVRASKSKVIMTLMDAIFMVQRPLGDGQHFIDPGDIIPSIQVLLDRIAELERVTEEARVVADNAQAYIQQVEDSADNAANSATQAATAAETTHTYMERAELAADISGTKADEAEASATDAENSKIAAQKAAESAQAIAVGSLDKTFVHQYEYKDTDILNKLKNVDGPGSKLDADTLDGYHADKFLNADNLTGGIVKVKNGGTGLSYLAEGRVPEGTGGRSMTSRKIADAAPEAGSTDLMTSGLAYAALIGKADNTIYTFATLTVSGWTSAGTQTINWSSIQAYSNVTVALRQTATAQQVSQAAYARIQLTAIAEGSITVQYYGSKPSVDIPIAVYISGIDGTGEAATVEEYSAQIERNTANLEALTDNVDRLYEKTHDDIYERAGALLSDEIDEASNSISFEADHVRGYLTKLELHGAHEFSTDAVPRTLKATYQYDGRIIVDGSENWSMYEGSVLYFRANIDVDALKLPANTGVDGAADLQLASEGTIGNATSYTNRSYVRTYSSRLQVTVQREGISTLEDFKAYLQSNPLTIWYRTAYFSTSMSVYFGVKVEDDDGVHGYAIGPTTPMVSGDILDFVTGTIIRNHDYMSLDGVNETVTMASGVFRTKSSFGELSRTTGVCTNMLHENGSSSVSTNFSVIAASGTLGNERIRRRTNDARVDIRDDFYTNADAFNAALAVTPLKVIFDRNEPLTEHLDPAKIVVHGMTTISVNNDLTIKIFAEHPADLNSKLNGWGLTVDDDGQLCIEWEESDE